MEEQIEQTNFKIAEVQHQNQLNADFNDELQHQLRDTEVQVDQKLSVLDARLDKLEQLALDFQRRIDSQRSQLLSQDATLRSTASSTQPATMQQQPSALRGSKYQWE